MGELLTYPYRTTDRKLWEDFSKEYKKAKLGKNLDEALTTLIKNFLEERKQK